MLVTQGTGLGRNNIVKPLGEKFESACKASKNRHVPRPGRISTWSAYTRRRSTMVLYHFPLYAAPCGSVTNHAAVFVSTRRLASEFYHSSLSRVLLSRVQFRSFMRPILAHVSCQSYSVTSHKNSRTAILGSVLTSCGGLIDAGGVGVVEPTSNNC